MNKWGAAVFLGAVFLGLGIFLVVCLGSIDKVSSGPMSSKEKLGKWVWQKHGCVECHCLFGNGGYLGPDLTVITRKMPIERLKRFFSEPPVMRPAKRRKHPELDEAKADAMIAYLKFTAKINTQGWPPQPGYVLKKNSGETKGE